METCGREARQPSRAARRWAGGVLVLGGLLAAGSLSGQQLDEFDYENLTFRGIGLEVGYLFPDRVDATPVFGGRIDLGYMGPGFRVVPTFSYWSSSFERAEVAELEQQLETLIGRETGDPVDVDLGEITWRDIALGVDGQYVWSVPSLGVLTFAGVGMTAHILNGEGEAISNTFIEDLLDAVSAGFNAHLGIEVPMSERTRLYGRTKYEFMADLRYLEFRLGGQIMVGPSLPDEMAGR